MDELFSFEGVKEVSGTAPAGIYPAKIEDVSWKTPKSGGNDYLNIMFRLENNQCVFECLCIMHEKENVKNIAMSKLKSLLMAGGVKVDELKFSRQSLIEILEPLNVILKLGVKKDDQYGDKNIIQKYLEADQEKNDNSDIPF